MFASSVYPEAKNVLSCANYAIVRREFREAEWSLAGLERDVFDTRKYYTVAWQPHEKVSSTGEVYSVRPSGVMWVVILVSGS